MGYFNRGKTSYLTWGWFHKGLELGIFRRDGSIHLRPQPNFYATKSFSKVECCALRRAPNFMKSTPARELLWGPLLGCQYWPYWQIVNINASEYCSAWILFCVNIKDEDSNPIRNQIHLGDVEFLLCWHSYWSTSFWPPSMADISNSL